MNAKKGKSRNLLEALLLAESKERDAFFPEQEEAPSSRDVVMNEQRDMPALEEYLHELDAGGGAAFH